MRALLIALTIFGFVAILPANPADPSHDASVAYESPIPNHIESARLQEETGEAEEEDLPWVPIVILAFLIPAAVLLIPSFLGKKGPGGH